MVTKSDLLASDWTLLRVEVSEHDGDMDVDAVDGYSRFWCKQAVLGAYWVAEKSPGSSLNIHLTEDVELEGFKEALSFQADGRFKRELLDKCGWEEVVRQVFQSDDSRQLSLFEE